MDLAQKSSYFFQKTTLLDFELCYTIIRPPAGILKRESPARNRGFGVGGADCRPDKTGFCVEG